MRFCNDSVLSLPESSYIASAIPFVVGTLSSTVVPEPQKMQVSGQKGLSLGAGMGYCGYGEFIVFTFQSKL